MSDCTCIADGYCPRFQRNMVGRLREICRGENISPERAAGYKRNWASMSPIALGKKLILTCFLSPGDLLAMSAAIYNLHETHPNKYVTDVKTSCNDIFAANPYITPVPPQDDDSTVVEMHYPAIDRSNQHSTQFIKAYTEYLESRLQDKIAIHTNRPMIFFSDDELKHNPIEKPYWIINAGGKRDYTCKQWPVEYYQEVVNHTKDWIQWVQIGENHQNHHALDNVTNLIGQTSFRELMILALHSSGGVGPVTALMHLMAAVEKPYICINGGRESIPWIQYQLQHTLHTVGLMDCCATGGCWLSRVVPLQTDFELLSADELRLNQSLCKYPILDYSEPVAECMARITPDEVISILKRYVSVAIPSGSL